MRKALMQARPCCPPLFHLSCACKLISRDPDIEALRTGSPAAAPAASAVPAAAPAVPPAVDITGTQDAAKRVQLTADTAPSSAPEALSQAAGASVTQAAQAQTAHAAALRSVQAQAVQASAVSPVQAAQAQPAAALKQQAADSAAGSTPANRALPAAAQQQEPVAVSAQAARPMGAFGAFNAGHGLISPRLSSSSFSQYGSSTLGR